jgi:hypothetical protein
MHAVSAVQVSVCGTVSTIASIVESGLLGRAPSAGGAAEADEQP